ncbi:alcohol dehydrogenase catalytic domain-containing protein [Natrinema ejinorense]|nr:alcohol dehydrogenase catalytic domain-containing protein [Natrinema ejinorense]
MSAMDCLQISEWGGDLERAERARPDPGEGEVLIDVDATSVGLTVANVIEGDLGDDPADLPRIPGHEIVGRVADAGSGVTGLEEGDLVAAYFYLSCGRCDACLRGADSLCANLDGFVSVDVDGGFAEYAALPARNAIEIPDTLNPVGATVIPDAIATSYHVMNQRADVDPGGEVLILGAGGGVGIHLVQMAQLFGASVTAVDRTRSKLECCRELGAERVVNTATDSLEDALETIGTTYDAVVDFTGATDLLEVAHSSLAARGRLVNLTTFPGRSIDLSPREQVFGETAVVGSRYCSKYELRRSATLVANGDIEPIVTETASLSEVPQLLDRIRAGDVIGRGAVVL